eukprot:5769424-Pleurochrysis_carterae.AAC.1
MAGCGEKKAGIHPTTKVTSSCMHTRTEKAGCLLKPRVSLTGLGSPSPCTLVIRAWRLCFGRPARSCREVREPHRANDQVGGDGRQQRHPRTAELEVDWQHGEADEESEPQQLGQELLLHGGAQQHRGARCHLRQAQLMELMLSVSRQPSAAWPCVAARM